MKSDLHKVLHPIAGRAMLLHLLATVARLGPEATVVVAGSLREQIESAVAGHNVRVAVQQQQLGTAHAVLQARDSLRDFRGDILILYGDVPLVDMTTMQAMLTELHLQTAVATVVLGFRPDDPAYYGRIIVDSDGVIKKMVEFKDATESELGVELCNSGIMAVRSEDLWQLLKQVGNDNAAHEYYLPDIVMLAAAAGRSNIVEECSSGEVVGINSRAELAEAEAIWQRRARFGVMASGATLIAPETVWFAYDTQIGRDVTIEPNVVFGPGVSVADGATIHAFSHLEGATVGPGCHVGPYARLRPGSLLGAKSRVGNFVEIKKTRLGKGAKVNHLTYLGDAEVGHGANIGAGTITCNYDGFLKYKTKIGAGAFIGSNSALVAPVVIGEGAVVAAGTTVTKDVAADALALTRPPQQSVSGWATRFRNLMRDRKEAP